MTTSNADGRFRIPGVAGGTYEVTCATATGARRAPR